MANKGLGFVKIYRSLQSHWLWTADEPFDIRSAWIDLIMMVNHEATKLKVGQQVVNIRAGQTWTSYVKLANRWKWSRERVYRYIKMLKRDGMIYVDGTPNGTLLTLVNYENFAGRGNTRETSDETTDKTSGETSDETSDETQTRMNKNEEELKNIRKELEPPRGGGEWQ